MDDSSFRALHTQPVSTSVALRCGDAAVAAVTVAICYIYVEFFLSCHCVL